MSCANTSLPWFIDPPRAMLPHGVAKPKFEIQIETKKINRLCVFHQQLTGAENPNVGTLLSEVMFTLRVGDQDISLEGVVRHSVDQEGMGIQFTNVSPVSKRRLRIHIASLVSAPSHLVKT